MTNYFKYLRITLLMGLMLVGMKLSAADCGDISKIFCGALDKCTDQVNKATTIDQVMAIDFGSAISNEQTAGIPDECATANITQTDKNKLKASINKLIDSFADKLYVLADGQLSKSVINDQFAPLRNAFLNAVDKSKTWNDLAFNFNNIQ